MKSFVISDLHFGHANIIKLANRPFSNVEEMDEKLIENWNSVVSDEDIVYVVGDFSFKGKNAENYLDRLNGKIVLIRGNHDKRIRHEKIIAVKDYANEIINGRRYIMSHYPMTSWDGMFRDSVLFYGHIHSNAKSWEYPNLPNAYCVNCEFVDYTPKEIKEYVVHNFVDTMKKKKLL